MSGTPNPTAALIAALWQRNLPVVRERVGLLMCACEAAQNGALSGEMRAEAHAAAHKLAGAMGMYGRPEAGEIASRIEHMLEPDAALDAQALAALTAELQQRLFPA